ncbi:MAG: glycosyltransferase family 2 protein [Desulfatibacillaceae bacterium]
MAGRSLGIRPTQTGRRGNPEIAVSVVIPLYNKEASIARTIESVLSQEGAPGFEIVVVDDGSTDGGPAVVESIGDLRIRLVRQKNQGVSAARNTGVRESRADLVAFLDADDQWRPAFLATVRRLARQYPECGAIGSAYEFVEPDGKRWSPRHSSIPPAPWEGIIPDYFRAAAKMPPVFTSGVAIRRGVLDELGGFRVGVRLGEDLDMWARIARRYPIAWSSSPLAVYRKDAAARACVQNPASRREWTLWASLALEVNEDEVDEPGGYPGYEEYVYRKLLGQAVHCMARGKRPDAMACLELAKPTREYRTRRLLYSALCAMPAPLVSLARGLFLRGIPKPRAKSWSWNGKTD